MMPGITYMPLASITRSPVGRFAPRAMEMASMGTTCVIRSFLITMSYGPAAGAPVPSMIVASRMTSVG